MSHDNPAAVRRADLDALRATAMLLGIALHASLSFFPSFWMVADRRQAGGFDLLFSSIHGFRMPLFFVMSGYFSAMLLHRRGRRSLLKHRFLRVFVPLLLGLFTIVPATNWISSVAMSSAAREREARTTAAAPGGDNLWEAASQGDLDAIARHLANGTDVNARDGRLGLTPLHQAALADRGEAVEALIRKGADPNCVAVDGGTPLQAAAFLGYQDAALALIRNGADLNAANRRGETALGLARIDEATTLYFASLLDLDVKREGLKDRKAAIAEELARRGAAPGRTGNVWDFLTEIPVFNHLWFLWFLWWLVIGLVIVSWLPGLRKIPDALIVSPARYLWLIPLTAFFQWQMAASEGPAVFGPETSTGLLPYPRVFAYYAIFFGFGALFFDRDGRADGRRWWVPLGLGLGVVFPLGLAFTQGWAGPGHLASDPATRQGIAAAFQAAYAWLLTFGLMGLFYRLCPTESPTMRYLSDSAYWLYLAHLPLVIGAQYLVRDWPMPALAKFVLIVTVVTAILLVSYQLLVRHSWLGRLLNGRRPRLPLAENA